MTNTSGFYKLIDGTLFFGPNFVLNAEYELYRETHSNMIESIDGWMFYPDLQTACIHLDIPIPNHPL